MSSSSQMSTTMLSPSHMMTSMLSPSHMPTSIKNDNTKCSGQRYHPAKLTLNFRGNAVIKADNNITIIIQTDNNIKYSRKHYNQAR
jgi:hypothetical protein